MSRDKVAYLPSWDFDFELDFRVGFSSWIFELGFRVGFYFRGVLLAGFRLNFQCFFYTTYSVIVLRCFQDGGERGWHIAKAILFNLVSIADTSLNFSYQLFINFRVSFHLRAKSAAVKPSKPFVNIV